MGIKNMFSDCNKGEYNLEFSQANIQRLTTFY